MVAKYMEITLMGEHEELHMQAQVMPRKGLMDGQVVWRIQHDGFCRPGRVGRSRHKLDTSWIVSPYEHGRGCDYAIVSVVRKTDRWMDVHAERRGTAKDDAQKKTDFWWAVRDHYEASAPSKRWDDLTGKAKNQLARQFYGIATHAEM